MFETLFRVVCLVQMGFILEVSLLGCNLLCISLYVINRIGIVIGHFGDRERCHLAMVRNDVMRACQRARLYSVEARQAVTGTTKC